jgi:hypothetical protein
MSDLENKFKDIESKIEFQFNSKITEIEKKLELINNLLTALDYKKIESIYFKSKLKNKISNNKLITFKDKIYKRQVYLYCQRKKIYLLMTNEGKVIQSCNKSKWEVQINFSDNSIIFFSNNLYLKENKGNLEGSKDSEKWNFEISNKSDYYFIYPKRITNNIISVESQEIKVNKNKPGDYEQFKLIDAIENYFDNDKNKDSSNLSKNVLDLFDSTSI